MGPIGWWLLTVSVLGGPAGELAAVPGHRRDATAERLEKGPEASAHGSETTWRRTRNGWERPSQWTFQRQSRPPALHPILVGLLEIFLASAALIAFSEPGNRQSQPGATPRGQSRHRRR